MFSGCFGYNKVYCYDLNGLLVLLSLFQVFRVEMKCCVQACAVVLLTLLCVRDLYARVGDNCQTLRTKILVSHGFELCISKVHNIIFDNCL